MEKELPKFSDVYDEKEVKSQKIGTDPNYKHEYIPHLVIYFIVMQFFGLIGMHAFFFKAKWMTIIWGVIQGFLSGQGVVLGSHRGYSHKSFKATTAGQLLLVFFHTMSGQNTVYWWARDHRLHHKFSDTDADPYNASRGFFFGHLKWLMCKKHPLVLEKGKLLDLSDLQQDKIVMFQRNHILMLHIIVTFMIPTLVPVFAWGESFWTSLLVNYFFKIFCVLHMTSSVNSFAHAWGTKPVDKRIRPTQSAFADWVTCGDGWHNYHHAFPWDCGMSEFGYRKGLSTRLLDFMAYCGLTYDLKKAPRSVVIGHARRHGDGSLLVDEDKDDAVRSYLSNFM